jgi:hypothetical protein
MATSTDLRAAIEEVQNQLPEDQLAGDIDGLYEADFATRIEERVGALPWWVISAVVHSVLFLLCTLIGVALPPPNMDEVSITTDIARKEEPKYDQKKKRDIFKNPQEVKAETQVENPVVVHEQAEVAETFETDNSMDNQNARGSEDAISDIPLGGTGVTGSMGVGGGGMAGCFGYRDGGGRKKAVARFGGSPATESAVEAALRWLARHQEKQGHWVCKKYQAREANDVGVTSLALLAFLGAGHTEKSGKFRDNVLRAQKWLMAKQRDDGKIHGTGRDGYEHAVAGLALAEAFGMARNPEVGKVAQKAIDYTVNVHQAPYSGWRYKARQKPDTSATGWFIMQLKSAKVAGLKVDGAAFQGATNWLDKVTDKQGRTGYTSKRGTVGMTAVGMVGRQFMGTRSDAEILKKGAKFVMTRPPAWPGKNRERFYYWYYGTLAMFQMGGENWKKWNAAIKPALVDNQRKGGPLDGSTKDDVDGSWDPSEWTDENKGGRVYTTALGALSLEVYYRYLPMYTK